MYLNFPFFRGTSGIDIDLRRVDINQCPTKEGGGGINIFGGTDKCKKDTTFVSNSIEPFIYSKRPKKFVTTIKSILTYLQCYQLYTNFIWYLRFCFTSMLFFLSTSKGLIMQSHGKVFSEQLIASYTSSNSRYKCVIIAALHYLINVLRQHSKQ